MDSRTPVPVDGAGPRPRQGKHGPDEKRAVFTIAAFFGGLLNAHNQLKFIARFLIQFAK